MAFNSEVPGERFDKLKNKPNEEEIALTLKDLTLEEFPLVHQMNLINTLLNYTVPEAYKELDARTRELVRRPLSSFVGISNVLKRINGLKHDATSDKLQLYVDVLEGVVVEGIVSILARTKKSPTENREIDKLFFKGKMFSVLNEVALKTDCVFHKQIFQSPDEYARFLSQELILLAKQTHNYKVLNLYVSSLMSFSSTSGFHFFHKMFSRPTWNDFVNLITASRRTDASHLVRKLYFNYILERYLKGDKSRQKEVISALASLLSFSTAFMDIPFLELVCESSNYDLSDLVSLLLVRHDNEVRSKLQYLMVSWGDEKRLRSEPLVVQENRSRLILSILTYSGEVELSASLTKSEVFLKAVSNRLSSFSDTVKLIGIILADKVCELGKQGRIFNLDEKELDEGLVDRLIGARNLNDYSGIENPWHTLEHQSGVSRSITTEQDNANSVNRLIDKLSIFEEIDKEDSDDEEFEENEEAGSNYDGTNNRQKVAKPMYIKTLLEYLTVDTNKSYAYKMRRIALIQGPTLIRQKAKFGSEVSYHSEDLLLYLLQLGNHFEDGDFEELRLSNLIAVLVANSASTPHLCNLLLTGDYSLQQRICILSAISLAVRELRGIDDDVVKKSFVNRKFPTKMLPDSVHKKVLSSSESQFSSVMNQLETSVQDKIMYSASEEANDILSGGKILRLSKNLNKEPQGLVAESKHRVEDFPRIVKAHFFYPLIEVWFQSGHINIGHYTPIFVAHYIKTLTLILHAGYPVALNMNDMIRDLFSIILPLTKKTDIDEAPLTESIITGLLLICDIMDDELLISEFYKEVELVQQWLTSFWEELIDRKSKSLAAALILKLSSLTEKFTRTIIDRSDGFF